jgi:hypothetical protein
MKTGVKSLLIYFIQYCNYYHKNDEFRKDLVEKLNAAD